MCAVQMSQYFISRYMPFLLTKCCINTYCTLCNTIISFYSYPHNCISKNLVDFLCIELVEYEHFGMGIFEITLRFVKHISFMGGCVLCNRLVNVQFSDKTPALSLIGFLKYIFVLQC